MTLSELKMAVEAWLSSDPDGGTRLELEELLRRNDTAELEERFRGPLGFGTAGLRAPMGAGPARMNCAVVRTATLGLARWLIRSVPESRTRGVVVARDGRHRSFEFASETVGVLAAAGIPAWVFPAVAPTPLAAYAVTALGAAAGVVVTASHNPKEYNGYKVYGPDGAQVIPPDDTAIAAEMAKVGPANQVPFLDQDEATSRGLLREVGADVAARYLQAILVERRHPGLGLDLAIAYTAMHGVGGGLAVEALKKAGFHHVHWVADQQLPDADFPTVAFPNPEEPGALQEVQRLAETVGADLVLANDPDADRLAVMVRDAAGGYRQLSGNEVGVLLGHYLLTHGPRPARPLVLATVVSSLQLGHIAARLGVEYEETLTGFKWIAHAALRRAEAGAHFVFGYEEALGYAVSAAVRDKDGIGAAVVMADMAGWARSLGRTVLDLLDELAREYGVYASLQRSVVLPGSSGAAVMARVMAGLREAPPPAIAGRPVIAVSDYAEGIRTAGGKRTPLGLPRTNLLAFELLEGARVLLRPSGTEPKLKLYVEAVERVGDADTLTDVRACASATAATLLHGTLELASAHGLEPGARSPPTQQA